MKKTQLIDLVSTIRNTAVSFIAIAVFIALGLAFYGGTAWSVVHSKEAVNQTYQEGRMRTLLVTDSLGLTEEQISALEAIDGIDEAEGLHIVYRFFENKTGVKQQAAVVQLTENVDKLMNVEGELPMAAGEAAVLRSWAEENGVALGDVIVLQTENAVDYRELQAVRRVAQWNGDKLEELLEAATADSDDLTEMTLTVTALVDSPVYLSTNPYAHGICAANGLYIDAVFFVSKQELPQEVYGAYTSVALYSETLSRLDRFSEAYKTQSQLLSEKVQTLLDAWDRQLLEDYSDAVNTLRTQLDRLLSLTGIRSEAGESLYELLNRKAQQLREQESFSAVTETDANSSFLTADNLIGVLGSLRGMLGITFLAIAVLICYSVISRLVADSSVQIGTRKALGFCRGEIIRFYLCYAGVALLAGGILGVLLGVFGIEQAFVKVLGLQFTFTSIPLICDLKDILPVFVLICGLILALTLVACAGVSRKSAISLLRRSFAEGERAKSIHHSAFVQRLSLLNQMILQNLFRDKRRVFGMLIGIAGSAALMTAGLSFYMNFSRAFTRQFQCYYVFDDQICYDAASETAAAQIRQVLDKHGLKYAEVYSSCLVLYTPDGKTNAPNVIVPVDPAELSQLMFFDTEEENAVAYDSGVWMSEYYRYAFDADVGSLLKLRTLNGREAEIEIDHYYKHHLSTPVIVMDAASYAAAFGESPAPNAFYVASEGLDMKTLQEELKGIEGYIYAYDFYESFLTSFESEEMVVIAFAALFGLMAVLLALMTIVNLLYIYISEKKNELIILMINGYDRSFARKYIYRDTVLLTLLGILLGLLAGSILGDQALVALEGTSVRLIHGISSFSCAVAAAVTGLLTALICRRALRRVDDFRLSDIDVSR